METSTESQTKQAEKGATRRNALLPGLVDYPEARRERRCSLAVSSLVQPEASSYPNGRER
jgi:hypothetical protein